MRTAICRVSVLMMATCLFFSGLEVLAEEKRNSPNSNTLELETVTVTAQKQEENVQDVPISINVLNNQGIDDHMIDSVIELADFVPNFVIFDNGTSGIYSPSMRGIHAFVESATVSTGLYVDGVPILIPAGFEDTLVDIERVEVLRGPQGTLYGKNTEAGAINIITRQPDNEFRGKISGDLGENNKKELNFSVSGPIQKDTLYFGLAGKSYEKDGYIENTQTGETVDDRRHWYGKGQLRWTPLDNLDISLFLSRLEYDDGVNNVNVTDLGATMMGLPAPEDRKIATDFGSNESVTTAQNLKIVYNFSESLRLTSITSNRVFEDKREADWDFNPVKMVHTIVDSRYTKQAQELRLDSLKKGLKWLVGVYYDKDDNEVNTKTLTATTDRDFEGDASAVFGQASIPFMEKFRLTAGLRYEKQKVEKTDYVASSKVDETWDEVTPKLALDYMISPETMAFVSLSKGYRSGNFNTYVTDPAYISYDEEILWSYEAGLKTKMMNNRVNLNGSLYYMKIEDMQVNQAITPVLSYVTNAAEASAFGAEVDITARVFDGVTLFANYGYTDISFDEFEDSLDNYEGNTPPYAPEYTFNAGVSFDSSQGFYFRCDLIGNGKVFLDKSNKYSRDAYEIVNAKIGYGTDTFDVNLYGKNIFDEKYDSEGIFSGLYTVYSEPREIGIKGTYRF